MPEIVSVAVAISTRERPEALARCLDALLAGETLPAEIVVVDQSRDRRSAEVVERATAGSPRGVELRHLRHEGAGLGASQNVAFHAARQEVVAVTDDDCVVDPRWLTAVAAAFAEPHPVDLLTGRVMPLGPDAPARVAVSSRTSPVRLELGPETLPWDAGSGNNFAVRRAHYLALGGCDERLGPGSPGLGGVDMDLFYRLLRAGARGRYEPDAVVFHERVAPADRLARRRPYGYGMGACCALRAAEGDRGARRLFRRWLGLRLRLLASGLRRFDATRVREELIVLVGTFAGFRAGRGIGNAATAPGEGSTRPASPGTLDEGGTR